MDNTQQPRQTITTPTQQRHTPLRQNPFQHSYTPSTSPNIQVDPDYIVTSPLSPAENHAAYIASLNSTNSYFPTSHIKKISELQIGQWYKVNAFIGKVSKQGKKYLTAKVTATFNYDPESGTPDETEVYLPDRFTNMIAPLNNVQNTHMRYNGMIMSSSGFQYHDITFQ